jgi:hypothetical protein
MSPDPSVFRFDLVDAEEDRDTIVRTYTPDGERWVDTLVTASGRRAFWNASEAWPDLEEAITWAKTVVV